MKIGKRKKGDPVILTVDQFNEENKNEIVSVDVHNKRFRPNIVSLTTEAEIEAFLKKEQENDAQ